MQTTSFYLGRFLKKLADDQCSSITKGSIYHINHMYIQPFTTVVDWPEIRCLREVSAMFYICRYCVFTWGGRSIFHDTYLNHSWHMFSNSIGVRMDRHTWCPFSKHSWFGWGGRLQDKQINNKTKHFCLSTDYCVICVQHFDFTFIQNKSN